MARNDSVPQWTLDDGIGEHEDCDESPCEACIRVETQSPDDRGWRMSSQLLRRAADKAERLAGGATPGEWVPFRQGDPLGPFGVCVSFDGVSEDSPTVVPCGATKANAAYIAALGPNVGTALAEVMRAVTETGVSDTMMRQWLEQDRTGRAMLHLARQILGPDAA